MLAVQRRPEPNCEPYEVARWIESERTWQCAEVRTK